MRENDGLLYRKIRAEHEKLCESKSNPHGTLSVNTACLWGELDMAEQEFPVRFTTDGEILVNGKDAYEWFEKWFGTWAKKHPEFFHSVKRDCQYRVKREPVPSIEENAVEKYAGSLDSYLPDDIPIEAILNHSKG